MKIPNKIVINCLYALSSVNTDEKIVVDLGTLSTIVEKGKEYIRTLCATASNAILEYDKIETILR